MVVGLLGYKIERLNVDPSCTLNSLFRLSQRVGALQSLYKMLYVSYIPMAPYFSRGSQISFLRLTHLAFSSIFLYMYMLSISLNLFPLPCKCMLDTKQSTPTQSINQPFIKSIFVLSSKQYALLSSYYSNETF